MNIGRRLGSASLCWAVARVLVGHKLGVLSGEFLVICGELIEAFGYPVRVAGGPPGF
jgi:hypothetical protein